MKNASLILNIILFVLVGVLFYLHFSATGKQARVEGVHSSLPSNNSFKIGYFEWDSLTNHYDLFKVMQNEINQKEEGITQAKMKLRQQYQNKVNGYSQKELSQVESEMATRELQKMEVDIRNQMQSMDQEQQDFQLRKQNEVKTRIEDFLKEYNKTKGYSFIFAYEPALIFYRDTMYNVTNDLIKGLNEQYNKKK